jgi:hypothetical protein
MMINALTPPAGVLMLDQEAGTLELTSYGETKELCGDAKKIGDVAFDAVVAHLK